MLIGEKLHFSDSATELEPITDREVVLLHSSWEKTKEGHEYELRHVHVDDPHDPEIAFQLEVVASMFNQALIDNPDWQPPKHPKHTQAYTGEKVVPNEDLKNFDPDSNPAWQWFYGPEGSSLRKWRELIPSAKALYPMQRLDDIARIFPEGSEPDERSIEIFYNMLDSIAIRTRAEIMKASMFTQAQQSESDELHVVSLGSGAAVAETDVAIKIQRELGKKLHMQFYDIDAEVLEFGKEYAQRVGLDMSSVTQKHANYLRALYLPAESQDFIDVLGLWEYLDRAACVKLLKQSYTLLKPGGTFIASNMLDNRKQFTFNQKGVGWWPLHARSVDELAAIVHDAGIDTRQLTITISEDGVYAVMEIQKPYADDVETV